LVNSSNSDGGLKTQSESCEYGEVAAETLKRERDRRVFSGLRLFRRDMEGQRIHAFTLLCQNAPRVAAAQLHCKLQNLEGEEMEGGDTD
jgi:hypothetical protein